MQSFTSPLKERKTKSELETKCVPQLFVGSFLETRQSAISQFFSLSLVTVPKVFAKVNSYQSPVSEEENSHNILTFCLTPPLPHRTLLRDRDVVQILNPYNFCHNIITTHFGYCFRYVEAVGPALIRSHNFAVLMEAQRK